MRRLSQGTAIAAVLAVTLSTACIRYGGPSSLRRDESGVEVGG